QSNSLILGSINGVNGATADTNVGIGTTTPQARLTVSASSFSAGDNTATFAAPNLGANLSHIHFGATGDWYIRSASSSGKVVLQDSGGTVSIGTTSTNDKLFVFGDIRVGTSGTNGCLKNNNGGTLVCTCSSDARFKRDILPFTNLLARLTRLRPVYFYWRSDEFPNRHFGQAREVGLIAQEVEKVLPELVSEDEQGYKAVNYSKLPLLSLQAIKELKAENDTLKQKLNEQQRQLSQ